MTSPISRHQLNTLSEFDDHPLHPCLRTDGICLAALGLWGCAVYPQYTA